MIIRGGAVHDVRSIDKTATQSTAKHNQGAATEDITTDSSSGRNPIQFFIFEGGLCPFAGRTWIVLEELGLNYDMQFINYRDKPASFLELVPTARVPALYNPNDGVVVYESAICNEYLCDLVLVAATEHHLPPVDGVIDGDAKRQIPNPSLFRFNPPKSVPRSAFGTISSTR